DFPTGRPDPRSTDPAYQKAETACASRRPQRGQGNSGGGRPPGKSADQAFTSCLADHRVELPAGGAAALDRSDPKVADALEVCAALLPSTAAPTVTEAPTT
ncbi:hypothetical protein, partial [Streptomyces sp. SID3343]|uniref:hypothetical protein n=1 Tax=Streptomyces sp. SID3343 TaxID=2690260 RepID=UPI0013BEE7F9